MNDASAARLQGAGVGLSVGSIAWGRRPATPPPVELTHRDQALLSTLLDLGYLTTSMLGLLFWGKESAAVNRRLKLLHDIGYIDKLRPRVRAIDVSREWIYRLSARGWQEVVSQDPRWTDHAYTPADVQAISYIEHDVQVNALITHLAALAARQTADERCGLIDRIPFAIHGPRSGVVSRRMSDTDPRTPSSAARQVRLGRAVPGTLVPDATLLGVDALGRRTAVLIEYDRTRRAHKQIDKLRRYDYFLTTGWRASRYAGLDLEPLVLFVCASERQLRPFLDAADRGLTAWCSSSSGAPGSGEHPGREQVAFTTRERLLAQDWRMLQVGPRPLERRGRDVVAVELALPALFRRPWPGPQETGRA